MAKNPEGDTNLTFGLIGAMVESNKLNEVLHPMMVNIVAESTRLQEAISPAIASLVASSTIIQNTISPAVASMVAESTRLQETIAPVIEGIIEGSTKFQHAISPVLEGMVAESTRLHELISPVIKDFVNESMRIQESFAPILSSSIAISSTLISTLNRVNETVKNLDEGEISVNSDGTVSLRNDFFKIDDIKVLVEDCISESLALKQSSSLESAINKILDAAGKKHPVLRIIVASILLPFLINVLTSVLFSSQSNNYYTVINQNKTIIVKNIRKEVRNIQLDNSFYKNYRFVSSDSLRVWSRNTMKSRVIGHIYFGQVVKVIHKQRNWTLIECSDENGEIFVEGWVLTRYTSRFK